MQNGCARRPTWVYGDEVFERFTPPARQIVALASDEAQLLRHEVIGTEHLLLGLLREGQGIPARVLGSLGVTVENAREQISAIPGTAATDGSTRQLPLTARAKTALELAVAEADSLGHGFVGTEHVLLGLLRDEEGLAVLVLRELDVGAKNVRERVVSSLSGSSG